MTTMWATKAADVVCPRCQALPGMPCRGRGPRGVWYHGGRVIAADAAAQLTFDLKDPR